jgi:hypothetical protein
MHNIQLEVSLWYKQQVIQPDMTDDIGLILEVIIGYEKLNNVANPTTDM